MKISIVIISKDEVKLSGTLDALQDHLAANCVLFPDVETVVVDASEGRLGGIERAYPWVAWESFVQPPGIRVSIPHQRNQGVRASSGEVIVFTDAGCIPQEGWLEHLVTPIVSGDEGVTCGPAWLGDNVYSRLDRQGPYVREAATINLAFRRTLFDAVGGFDETFAYGSDMDFTWRLVDRGTRIRWVPDAVVLHDWGTFRRQLKRSRQYGAARVRLYRKHRGRRRSMLRNDPVPVVYALYLAAMPLCLRYRTYLLLPLVPLWRARHQPFPVRVVICHLAEGIGALEEGARTVQKGASRWEGR